ncbi:hypothetical protein M408DRAFT_23609 [Serendipita vermifera MAFF 305830]|uniref:F-box domain-containing protein n=1 Tax=Serendipita vermifera MAFF 305830 TaxID=933852 RepID=A0A0C2WQU2_SERVB|nr:hypothetical protein M408DRAFT_23609 [Serendipita vermifera MAFF 305830]
MWSPADIHAFPTPNDLEPAKEAIEEVESQIANTTQLMAQTQLRLKALEKELEKELEIRKAWISPVRRVLDDVLSLIFEACGELHWKMPLCIAAVSRRWREIILATPRAWAYIQFNFPRRIEGLDQFFTRSGQCPLHVYLPHDEQLTLLSSVSHRLKSLSIGELPRNMDDIYFPYLNTLNIRNPSHYVDLCDLNQLFPHLQVLKCMRLGVRSNTELESWESIETPPLKSLSLKVVMVGPPLFMVLQSVKDTLVSLKVIVEAGNSIHGSDIVLPNLQDLTILYHSKEPASWLQNMKTPNLKTYIESSSVGSPEPICKNLDTVQRASFTRKVDITPLRKLCLLQLEPLADILHILDQLSQDVNICPKLELITIQLFHETFPAWDEVEDTDEIDRKKKLAHETQVNVEHRLSEVNALRSQQIRIVFAPNFDSDVWGAFDGICRLSFANIHYIHGFSRVNHVVQVNLTGRRM